jgi:PAS domain S-box-containing protein
MTQTSVMVVEGERVAALGIRTQLQRAGYLVPAIVSYGEDVVHEAAEIDPDLVLMNVQLKGEVGGLEAARRLQAQSDIPVVYLLATTDPDAQQQVKSAATYGYLSRPFDERELQTTIEMALYKHSMDRELRAYAARVGQSHAALRLLGRLMDDACKGQGTRALLRTACRELADILDAPYAVAVLLEQQAETAHLMGEFVLDGQRQSLDANIKVDGTPLLQYALARGEPWVIEDMEQDPHVSWVVHRLPKNDAYSTLILPLVSDEAILGGLALTVTRTRGFGEEDVALGWTVVSQLADAIAHIQHADQRSRLSAAIEQMAEAVMVADLSGKIVYANQAFEQMSGYAATELLGHSPRLLRDNEEAWQVCQELRAAVRGGQVWRGRLANRKREGTLYTADVSVTPLRDETGRVTHYVSVEREIPAGLARDKEARPADEMEGLDQLASGIAHDLNNLLTTINGNASLLLYDEPDSEISEMVQAILEAGERAAELTRRLVLASRKQVAERHATCLNNVVEEMRDTLQHAVGKQISLQIGLAPDLWASQGDPVLIREMIASLADNAYDAMPGGGQLIIRTANVSLPETSNGFGLRAGPGEYVMLSVEDTGIGMSEDVQQHLFEPFFTTKRRGEGAGLGLVTVHRIVRQCNGAIEVESAEGRGTLVRIYLPCAPGQKQTRELPELRTPGQRGKETILLVEDDDSIFELTQRVLARSGYTLLTARDGLEAKQVAENHQGPIDLLLTDLTMPRMDGKTLAQGLIRIRPGLKVLLMSGYAGAVPSADGQGIEEMAFVQKPFRPQDLVQQVRAVLDRGPVPADLWSLERTGP